MVGRTSIAYPDVVSPEPELEPVHHAVVLLPSNQAVENSPGRISVSITQEVDPRMERGC